MDRMFYIGRGAFMCDVASKHLIYFLAWGISNQNHQMLGMWYRKVYLRRQPLTLANASKIFHCLIKRTLMFKQLRQDKIIRNAELSFSCLLIPHKLVASVVLCCATISYVCVCSVFVCIFKRAKENEIQAQSQRITDESRSKIEWEIERKGYGDRERERETDGEDTERREGRQRVVS